MIRLLPVAPNAPWLSWFALGSSLIVAFATPVAFLGSARVQRELEAHLTAAGVPFSGHPPTHSAKAFSRWITRNALETESIRSALQRQ